MLEQAKHKTFVVPAINWLWATLNEAEAFGYTHAKAEKDGYGRELQVAVAGLREMHKLGIVVLPGGSVRTMSTGLQGRALTNILAEITASHGRHTEHMRETSSTS